MNRFEEILEDWILPIAIFILIIIGLISLTK